MNLTVDIIGVNINDFSYLSQIKFFFDKINCKIVYKNWLKEKNITGDCVIYLGITPTVIDIPYIQISHQDDRDIVLSKIKDLYLSMKSITKNKENISNQKIEDIPVTNKPNTLSISGINITANNRQVFISRDDFDKLIEIKSILNNINCTLDEIVVS